MFKFVLPVLASNVANHVYVSNGFVYFSINVF